MKYAFMVLTCLFVLILPQRSGATYYGEYKPIWKCDGLVLDEGRFFGNAYRPVYQGVVRKLEAVEQFKSANVQTIYNERKNEAIFYVLFPKGESVYEGRYNDDRGDVWIYRIEKQDTDVEVSIYKNGEIVTDWTFNKCSF